MNNKLEQQRLNNLFADLDVLALDSASNTPVIRWKLDELYSRLFEIQKQLAENEKRESSDRSDIPSTAQPRPMNLMVYEKDQIGYSYSNEKVQPLQNLTLAPDPNNALTSPLTVSGQAIGELQIGARAEQLWTSEETNLANSVAQQVSLQIQNLRLLAATERSRAEAESATRQFMHAGWDSYLDAIHQNERIGFAYDQASVIPYTDKLHVNGGFQEMVKVMDEQVGALYLKPHANRPLSLADKTLVSGVANHIAQQVENIRLLADASRARAEAEDAVRRVTRDNWQPYTDPQEASSLGFIYDSIRVFPIEETSVVQDVVLTQPLMVRGETIGQLTVAGWKKSASPEVKAIAAAIATQASIHLETLRLSEELKKRARELEELDRLKSAFLANMSHELRTPLNSILGFTDVMLEGYDGSLTEPMDNDLRLIQKNGQHLLHLINDVLDMAKIESGRMNLHPERFKVHSVMDEVISITSTLASEKNLSLFIDENSDQEVEIYADNIRIRQVMINLVNNSIKFTETGKIAVSVKPMEGGRVLISVKDTGIGIPPDKLENIFQEFTQVDTSTTRKVGGTGLGLPISRHLVEMHGGRVWVESTGIEGEGSVFYVELPVEARITEVIEKLEK